MALKTALFYERYELKYHIPLWRVDDICDWVSGFCELDDYSGKSSDGYYAINNLYLDTPNYLFFNTKIAGQDNAFNMRIRTYGMEETNLYFMEVKKKTGEFCRKTRAKAGPAWFRHLEEGTLPEGEGDPFALDFARRVHSYRAGPVVFTQYRRKALFSVIDEYARITFDKDMRYAPRDTYDFSREGLLCYDQPEYFDDGTNVVLELKCESRVPLWMLDLIRTFDLKRASFSKFMYGVNETMQDKVGVATHPHRLCAF